MDETMRYTYRRGLLWIGVYVMLSAVPLLIALAGSVPAARTFWIEFGVALGFIALAMFGLQSLFSGRFAWIAPTFGMDNIINYHREIGIVATVFALAHPVILITAEPEFLEYFDPTVNFLRTLFLSMVTIAILLITASSIWRLAFKLNYEWWRLLHGALGLFIVFVGIVHSVQVSHYLDPLWKKGAIVLVMGACTYLVFHTRIVRPWRSRKKPYRLTEVKEELPYRWTLTVEPQDFRPMEFAPGQFAWITVGDTPFTLQQHPFSFASGSRESTIRFTAKVVGDFTESWKDMESGTKVFLEGPFGSFTPEPDSHLFLVMGGIGVTPAMSMLRTFRDDKDPRKAVLLYANVTADDIVFQEELEELRRTINLDVVYIVEEPPEGWTGESGLVTQELLDKYLPVNRDDYTYFICGPGPMMDIAEISLRNLGVNWRRIYTERFEIV